MFRQRPDAPEEVWPSVFEFVMNSRFGVEVSTDTGFRSSSVERGGIQRALADALHHPAQRRPLSETLKSGARVVVMLPRFSESPDPELMRALVDYLDAWGDVRQVSVVVLPDTPTGILSSSNEYLAPWMQFGALIHRLDQILPSGQPRLWDDVMLAVRNAEVVLVVEQLQSFMSASTVASSLVLDRCARQGAGWDQFLRDHFAQRIDAVLGGNPLNTHWQDEPEPAGRFFAVYMGRDRQDVFFAAGCPMNALQIVSGRPHEHHPLMGASETQQGVVAVVERPWSLNIEHAFCVAVAIEVSMRRQLDGSAPLLVVLEGPLDPPTPAPTRKRFDLVKWLGRASSAASESESSGFDTLFDSLARGVRALGLARPIFFVHPSLSEGAVDGISRFADLASGLAAWQAQVPVRDDEDGEVQPSVTLVHNPQNQWGMFETLRKVRPFAKRSS
jgi:hypothetical protein